MQTIYLDISNRGVIPVIYAKQGDVGRKVEVVLTNSGLPYEPEAGSAFSAWFSGASGVGNYTDVGDRSAFSVSGNKVTVELITQMLQNAGEGILCMVLSRANGDQIGLWNIRYICEGIPGAGSDPAKDYYTAFSQAVAGLAYPDASLSVAGKAADAAAVGTALAGKAPAGYGLGGYGEEKGIASISELDNFKANGKFTISQTVGSPLVLEGIYFNSLLLEVSMLNANYGTQIVRFLDGSTIRRVCEGGVWQPWEWENPPMVPGVEYRTTERWNGQAVYTCLIYCGEMANGASTIPVVVNNEPLPISRLVRYVVTGGRGQLPMWFGEDSHTYNCSATYDNKTLYIYNNGGYIGMSLYAQFWYVK